MHRNRPRFTLAALLAQWRNLFGTQPAPAIWFDRNPCRRVRRNAYRRVDLTPTAPRKPR